MTTPHDPPPQQTNAGHPRRRRSLRLAVAAAVTAVAVAVGVAVVVASGDDPSPEEAGTDHQPSTGASSTNGKPGAEVSSDGDQQGATGDPGLRIEARQLDDTGVLRIRVSDPSAPTAEGADTRACVLVTYWIATDGLAAKQVFGCADPGATAALELDPASPVTIGCAMVMSRQVLSPTSTEAVDAGFTVTPTGPLPVGATGVTVQAVTGYGDGCDPPDLQGSEHLATTSLDVMVG